MIRRYFLKTSFMVIPNFLIGYIFFGKIKKKQAKQFKVTHIVKLPVDITKEEYDKLKVHYVNFEKNQSIIDKYKKIKGLTKEVYKFTQRRSIWILYCKDKESALSLHYELNSCVDINKMKKILGAKLYIKGEEVG